MSRIRKMYEARFRALLRQLNARRLEPGVQRLRARATQMSARKEISPTHALTQVHARLREQVEAFANRLHRLEPGASRNTRSDAGSRTGAPRRFLCDAGLGGLARWLRAAGYETIWTPDIDDAELVRQARRLDATILTTDSLLMERGVLRDKVVPGFWLPPTLRMREQLALVFREFRLVVHEPRCTSCGGELRRVAKESVRQRIPPRTALWLDEYFVCARCEQLFWRGTHWRSINEQLQRLSERSAS